MNELQSLVDDECGTQHLSLFAIDYISNNTNNSTPEIMIHTTNTANATSNSGITMKDNVQTANDTNDTSTPDILMEENDVTANNSNGTSAPDIMMDEQNADIDYFDDLEYDDNDENSSDNNGGTLLGSIEKAKNVTLDLMDALKDEFGINAAKQIIVDTAKVAGISLFAKRDMSISIDVDVNDLKRKIQGFTGAALTMTKRSNNVGVVALCIEISKQIKRLDNDKENHKELNKGLQIGLEIKAASQFSKFRRKCDCVRKWCNVVGVVGGCAMGMHVKIYLLENMVNIEFKDLIKELRMNRRLISFFCQTLRVDDTGMLMIRQSTATATAASIPSSSTSS
ncbi:hypothetical protein PS15p_210185 [Mucor circinelloides]